METTAAATVAPAAGTAGSSAAQPGAGTAAASAVATGTNVGGASLWQFDLKNVDKKFVKALKKAHHKSGERGRSRHHH